MKTMTIRNIPEEVAGQLKALADQANTSINSAVVQVLVSSVMPRKVQRKRRDLSSFCGGWTQKEFNEFERMIVDCEQINVEAWK